MYTYDQDPWRDLQADDREELQVQLDLARAERVRVETELKSLQSAQNPKDLTAQLASELGQDVETVRAKVAAVKAAAQGPQAGDPEKLSELLAKVDPLDYAGAVKAFDQAGFQTIDALGQVHQNGRMQRAPDPKGSTAEIYSFLDGVTSLEVYQARLAQVGLLEGGAS